MTSYYKGDPRSRAILSDNAGPILYPCSVEGIKYQFDPYVGCSHQCCYCYALVRDSYDWCNEISWYANMTHRLSNEMKKIDPQVIYMGWYSDPYQPIEGETQLTRDALSQFVQYGFSVSLLTKSTLVARDIDLLTAMPKSSVGISVSFIDEEVRSFFEAGTCQTRRRIAVLEKLRAAGIRTYALVCPVIPFVTDTNAIVRAVAPHAESVWIYRLRIRDEEDANWQKVLAVLRRHFPDVTAEIADAVFHTDHPFWAGQHNELSRLAEQMRVDLRIEF